LKFVKQFNNPIVNSFNVNFGSIIDIIF